jgi:hypothetical protein
MSSVWYAKGIQKIAQGLVALESDTIKAVLLDTADYTLDRAADEFLDDIPSSARVSTCTLSGVTVGADGVIDADDGTFPAVSGDPSEAVVIYKYGTGDADSPLLLYLDGVAVTPDNSDIICQWPSDANKIARLYTPPA